MEKRGSDKCLTLVKKRLFKKNSLHCKLQVQTLPDANPPTGKIQQFSKIDVSFDPLV